MTNNLQAQDWLRFPRLFSLGLFVETSDMILYVEYVAKSVHVASGQGLHHILEIILGRQLLHPLSNEPEVVLRHGGEQVVLNLIVEEDEPPVIEPA